MNPVVDALGIVSCKPFEGKARTDKAILMVASDNYAHWLFTTLLSMLDHNNLKDFTVYVILAGANPICRQVADYFDCEVLEAQVLTHECLSMKSIIYQYPHLIQEKWVICMDIDTVHVGTLNQLWKCPEGVWCSLDGCIQSLYAKGSFNFASYCKSGYYRVDLDKYVVRESIKNSRTILNDGVLYSDRDSMIDTAIKIKDWLSKHNRLAIIKRDCQLLFNIVALDYNLVTIMSQRYNSMVKTAHRKYSTSENGTWYHCDLHGPKAGDKVEVSILHYAGNSPKEHNIREQYMGQFPAWCKQANIEIPENIGTRRKAAG